MFDETSDILGGHTLPNVRGNGPGQWSSLSFTLKFAFILALVLVGYVTSIRVWEHLLKWRERTYKLSMRRRHGIPDNDRRPFNVAFAAVVRARQDHEATDRSRRQAEQPGPSHDQLNALPEQNIRQRPGAQRNVDAAWPNGPVNGPPGRFNSVVVDTFGSTSSSNVRNYPSATPDPLNFSDRYNPNPPINQVVEHGSSPPRTGPSHRSSRKNLSIKGNDDDGRKRAFDEDDDVDEPDNVKKTKVEGDELIDGDEDPEWQERHQQPIKRGSKRVLGEEDDDEEAAKSKRKRDKRARKISIDRNPQAIDVDHIMGGERDVNAEDEDEDEVTELQSISRGKKRDRAEAGSTFGGDDEDSPLESEGEGDAQTRRRRKRRTVSKRKSDVGTSSRGKKRDRDLEEEDSGGEAEDWATRRLSRKKRGKKVKGSDEERKGGSDVSMDDSVVSKGKGRRVGDEWESNGVRYKVSPNGQRLRQALVKKARQKFTMPKDSQHPDRIANLEVCVETWLTEDEFKEAKAQHLLAWQDSPKPSVEPETPTADNQESPSSPAPVGKNLLWGSPASSSSAPSPTSSLPPQGTPTVTSFATPQTQPKPKATRNTYRHSIATNVGLRINPFQQPQAPPNRRVASTSRVVSVFSGVPSIASSTPGLADSTNSSPRGAYRMFSKWEKQELEAEAMRKMREANRKKEREREEKEREEKERKEKEKREKEKACAEAAVPLISITKPAEDTPAQSENKPPPTFSFTPQSAAGVLKPPSFSLPKTPTSPKVSFATPTPTVSSSSTSTQQKPQSESAVPNSFGPPSGTSGKSASSSNTFSFAKEPVAEPFPNAANTNTSSSVFGGRTTQPVAGASAQKHAKPAKPSGFSLPSGGGNTASGNAGSTPASAPSFSFAPPAQGGQSALAFGGEQKKAEGASLLSRVGGFGGKPEGANSGSTLPQSQPQQVGSVFSFNKPASDTPKPTSVFGVSNTPQNTPPSTTSNVTTAAPPATVGTSSGLKFNFGLPGKASSSTPAPAPGATSVNGAPSVDSSKPNLSSFGFAPAKSSASISTTSAEPASGASAPKYNFGAPPSTSAFANHSGGQNSTPSTQPKDAPAKSTFGGFGGGPSSNGTFSKTTPTASTSAFGSGTNTNVFGGSNSTFGASGSKSKEAPKPTFSFATPAAPSPSANGNNGEALKTAFSFPNPSTTPSANPAAAPSPFSFKFGDSAPNNSTTPQASPLGTQPPPAQSAFGSNSDAGAFGFGTTPTSGAFSGFGGASKSTGQ